LIVTEVSRRDGNLDGAVSSLENKQMRRSRHRDDANRPHLKLLGARQVPESGKASLIEGVVQLPGFVTTSQLGPDVVK
jgi:hypothetical protein